MAGGCFPLNVQAKQAEAILEALAILVRVEEQCAECVRSGWSSGNDREGAASDRRYVAKVRTAMRFLKECIETEVEAPCVEGAANGVEI